MVSDEEVIAWAREKYPQYLGNIELLRSLYRRQVKGESVGFTNGYRKPLLRMDRLEPNKRIRAKVIVVEIRKRGEKNKKWFSVIIGDTSGMKRAIVFMDKNDKDLEEGKEYIMSLHMREDGNLVGDIEREVSAEESLRIDEIYDYVYELNGGRVQKDKFMVYVTKRGLKFEDVVELFGFRDEGDTVVGVV